MAFQLCWLQFNNFHSLARASGVFAWTHNIKVNTMNTIHKTYQKTKIIQWITSNYYIHLFFSFTHVFYEYTMYWKYNRQQHQKFRRLKWTRFEWILPTGKTIFFFFLFYSLDHFSFKFSKVFEVKKEMEMCFNYMYIKEKYLSFENHNWKLLIFSKSNQKWLLLIMNFFLLWNLIEIHFYCNSNDKQPNGIVNRQNHTFSSRTQTRP